MLKPMGSNGTGGWWRRLDVPVDNASIVFFRIAFGLIMLWEVFRYFENGWIPRYWIDPGFLFPYEGFSWVRPWPGDGMYYHFYALGALAILITIGLWYRIAAILFFLAFTYAFLLCQTRYLNHFYLISLISFLMIFIPANRALSADARHRPQIRSDRTPAWTLWLLRAQIGLVYFLGGVAKLNWDWLRAEPIGQWMRDRTGFPLIGPLFGEPWMAFLFAYGGLLLDLLVVPLLLWKKTRIWAFAATTFFHVMNAHLFSIGIFPMFMIAGTLLFFPPDWPVRFFGLRRSSPVRPPDRQRLRAEPRPVRTATVGLLACYLAVQVVVPLRHWLYPGNVSWTEEGHRFSWHMKLRSKNADARFYATDPVTGATWEVDALDYITPRQEGKMATRPLLIYQLAQHIAEDLRGRGHARIEIRADIEASLNDRDYQYLIDPDVDLASIEWSLFRPKHWIPPLEEPLH